MSEIPRRSSTLFEKSGATVRRLARRISLSVLNRDRDSSRSSSVATLRRDSSDSTVTPAPERPRSRISRWRSNGTSHGSNVSSLMPPSVIEEPSEDAILRSATPRGFDGGKKQVNRVAVQLPWAVPKARVFRHGRTGGQVEYDVSPLVYGRKVNELWFPTGDTLIYLCSKSESHRYSPSFKLSSSTLRRKSEFFTAALSECWQEHSPTHRQLLAAETASFILYFPPWEEDLESVEDSRNIRVEEDYHELLNQLVATRNFFAYLFGRPSVCLEEPLGGSLLNDFMDRMEMYVLSSNRDVKTRPTREQTLRDIEHWIRAKELDDVRKSPHRIVDILTVSERFKWPDIYVEAFTHGAGRYDFLATLPDIHSVSPRTRQLLERASFDIKSRVRTTEAALSSFKFPGILEMSRPKHHRSSARSGDSNLEIPPAWRRAYLSFRKWTMAYYTRMFRVKSWPPARFTRGMILQLHNDFQALYELMVDEDPERNDQFRRALERVLSDFDATETPIPLPRLPQLPSETSPLHNQRQSRDAISVTLLDSYNLGAGGGNNQFVEAFKEFERSYGTDRTVTKSVEAREGRWCLVFAVLSTLRSVFDGWDGLKYRWGVEYWLCAELKGIPSWALQSRKSKSGSTASALEISDAWEEGGSDLSMAPSLAVSMSSVSGPATPRRSVFG